MSVSEFELIQRYFTTQTAHKDINQLGIGDDCALMSIPKGYQLAITTDTMVEGIHFFAGTNAKRLGHKLLAVNLSDLAAMGAKPVSVMLALTLPEANENWLQAFSEGFLNLAKQFSVDLIGGDTTSGPLTLTVQAMGLVPENQAMLRSTAKLGDLIYVTGNLGQAGLGYKIEQGYTCSTPEQALNRFHQPIPRVTEALAIKNSVNSCIDSSDGIASDLNHILTKSNVGATIYWDKLPLSTEVHQYIQQTDDWEMPLSAGDDYELCFSVSSDKVSLINIDCTQIGIIEKESGLRLHRSGMTNKLEVKGFEHFS